ncbi:MAG: hypothetical protein A4E19_18925 [Nitrospira sp. SG-bin1]|nr:MAG: hypothetical protein A4E19_18925 [Nitrospira sp. SG-bin1]
MRLVSLPVQIIQIPEGIILKRGSVETIITGTGACESVKIVLEQTARNGGATVEAIHSRFARSSRRYVSKLLSELIDRRFLMAENSISHTDVTDERNQLGVYHWHFNLSNQTAMERLKQIRFAILGINSVSRQLVRTLQVCGLNNLCVVDHVSHRNPHFFDEAGSLRRNEWSRPLPNPIRSNAEFTVQSIDCLVATSDVGSLAIFSEWNKQSLEHGSHFMPVILKDMIGYVGPMIVPGEGACYDCLLTRMSSNSIHREIDKLVEDAGHEHGRVVGFHPAMASVLGDIAAFQLTAFYSQISVGRAIGQLLEVNLLGSTMKERAVLRVPRCAACGLLRQKGRTNLYKTVLQP